MSRSTDAIKREGAMETAKAVPHALESQHPFAWLLRKYIRPLGITREQMQAELDLPPDVLDALYALKRGLTPLDALKFGRYFGIAPELLLHIQADYDLAQIGADDRERLAAISSVHRRRPDSPNDLQSSAAPSLLLATLNNSLSRPETHYTEAELTQLFYAESCTPRQRYAVRVLFQEASVQSIVDFLTSRAIPMDRLYHLYILYCRECHGTPKPCIEWLFQDVR